MGSLRVIKSDISRIVPAIDSRLNTISSSIIEIKTDLQIKELFEQSKDYELPTLMPRIKIELPEMIRPRKQLILVQ